MRAISIFMILVGVLLLGACARAVPKQSEGEHGSLILASDDSQLDESKLSVFAKLEKETAAKIKHIEPKIYLAANRLRAGHTQRFAVVIDIENGWHINTNVPRPSYVIPTSVTIAGEKKPIKITDMWYPKGHSLPIPGAKVPLTVYEGQVIFFGDLTLPKELAGQTKEITFSLKYQLCNDRQCLAPKTVKLKGKSPVVESNQAVKKVNADIFKKDPRRSKRAGE